MTLMTPKVFQSKYIKENNSSCISPFKVAPFVTQGTRWTPYELVSVTTISLASDLAEAPPLASDCRIAARQDIIPPPEIEGVQDAV